MMRYSRSTAGATSTSSIRQVIPAPPLRWLPYALPMDAVAKESTLLVAALRAVGIPARQVYTPRWAHTDDNHAWVEAWVDGKWLFLGACEPEPVLNLAWFNAPVSRAMLVHTKAFGRYDGPEEVIGNTPTYTEINVIDNYAHVGKVSVQVTDATGRPLAGVPVSFRVYNYGEFYTVATKVSDAAGRVSLTAGQGDMLVYASKPEGDKLPLRYAEGHLRHRQAGTPPAEVPPRRPHQRRPPHHAST